MRPVTRFCSALLIFGLMALMALPQADAGLFGKKDKDKVDPAKEIETFQPPPANAMDLYCEPLRREAAELDQVPAVFKIFVKPQRMLLIRRHERCKAELMRQEHEYLKHVDIQQSPSLPKLKTDDALPRLSPEVPVTEKATMPESNELVTYAGLLALAEFLFLAVLGYLLFTVIRWEQALATNRDQILDGLRNLATQLRKLRRGLEKMDGEWPSLPMGPKTRRGLTVARWIFRAVFPAETARS